MRSLFQWLDRNPGFYWSMALLASLALLAWVLAGLYRAGRDRPGRGMSAGFALLLFLFLLAWRWPYLFCASEYNPDESQFVAGAMALAHDPVFWRSVDGVTSGPLDFYALLPLHVLGLPLDYFSARLTALLLIWGMLLLLARTFRALATPAIAQLAVLPGAVFFAAATAADFVHYSSELTPLALLALAVMWIERRPLAAAFVAGCLPWAKLQAAPLTLAVLGWQLWQVWRGSARAPRPWRRSTALAASAALPGLVVVGLVAAFGQWEHFFRRFVLQNIAYVGGGQRPSAVFKEMVRFANESGHFIPWLWATLGLVLVTALLYRRPSRPRPPLFWLAAALTVAAVVCIATPARSSLHYLYFLSVPLTLLTGVMLCDLWNQGVARTQLVAVALTCALVPLAVRVKQPTPRMVGQLADHWRRPYTPIGQILRHWQPAGARLALWGWMSYAYVEGGLPQVTRDTVSQWCIVPVSQREYYRKTFLAEMKRHRPEVFVDAVGVGAPFFYQRATQAHEIYPALADYVRENYRLVVDLQLARVYVRTDFLESHPLSNGDLRRLAARARRDYGLSVVPDAVAPANLPAAWIDDEAVQMLQPPAELRWHLTGTERSIRFDFGMHPKSYTEGVSDGAEFIVELRMPGQPPLQIFHRLLDPQHKPHDRGRLTAEVDLPPFPPDTALVVRTTAGAAGNDAWDWVYLAGLHFSHSPFYLPQQFPGFRRVPNKVDDAYPYLVHHEAEWLLMLSPPGELTFVLDGDEREFNFAYGLAEGSYTGAGQTDGASFIVEVQRDGEAPRNIFRRYLNPLANEADRGRQTADLTLPPDTRAGDRIVLRLDPGAGTSWDWTYIAGLDLH